jgi:hypothetical protein
MVPAHRLLLVALSLAGLLAIGSLPPARASNADDELPARLADTGLFADGEHTTTHADVLPFSPQYPLWSDGAAKRRWLRLPPGSFIDASRPDAWEFPPGTRLWKEFSHQGQRIETRYIARRLDGRWQYATYLWDAGGRDARLAPPRGVAALPVAAAPGGRYEIPARSDCTACHEGAAVPVLGVGALQLSPERDPLAVHGQPIAPDEIDLRALVARGWLRHLPPALLADPPRIAAASATERAALGYLHANCGHCHNADDGAPVRLVLAQSAAAPEASRARVLASLVDAPSRFRPHGATDSPRIVAPGMPDASLLAQRMRSRAPTLQMPPLGTQRPDAEALALVERWITHDLLTRKEPLP